MRILLLSLVSLVYTSDVDILPKLASELVLGDAIMLGDEPANVTDVSLNDDGSLTVMGLGVFSDEFSEKELDPNDIINVSTISINEQKVLKIDENDYIVLEDSEGVVSDDAEVVPELMDKLRSALKLKVDVKAIVVNSFGVKRVLRLIL